MPADSLVSIAVLYPELLGTYGDWGNAAVLSQRLRWRDIDTEVLQVGAGQTVPTSCELYVLGGGEDGPQALAARELSESRALHTAVDAGAVVFGVCAGIQILGHSFANPDGSPHPGLGLLDCLTVRSTGRRRARRLAFPAGARRSLTGPIRWRPFAAATCRALKTSPPTSGTSHWQVTCIFWRRGPRPT